jgi:hypothetical protein
MKKTTMYLIAAGLMGVLLLSACQTGGAPAAVSTSAPTPTPSPIPLPTEAALADPPTPAPLPTASLTPSPSTDPAAQAIQDFFSNLGNKDPKAAADLYSTFSLTADNLTRGNAAEELHNQMQSGTTWSGLEVKDTQTLDEKTILVHVLYTLTTRDPKTGKSTETKKDELWPVRRENDQWRYNRNNLIDFRTLSIPDKAMGGLRIKPLQLLRFSDHLRLLMMVQNTTNEAIVLGQPNEIMASFGFKDQQVEAAKQQLIFQPLRTYSQVGIDVNGLFPNFPDEVSIRQWKNLQVEPWFKFRFNE